MPRLTSNLEDFAADELEEYVANVVGEDHAYTAPAPPDHEHPGPRPILTSFVTSEFLARVCAVSPPNLDDTTFMKLYQYLHGKPEVEVQEMVTFAKQYSRITRFALVKRSAEQVNSDIETMKIALNEAESALDMEGEMNTEGTQAAVQRAEERLGRRTQRLKKDLALAIEYMQQLIMILETGIFWDEATED